MCLMLIINNGMRSMCLMLIIINDIRPMCFVLINTNDVRLMCLMLKIINDIRSRCLVFIKCLHENKLMCLFHHQEHIFYHQNNLMIFV